MNKRFNLFLLSCALIVFNAFLVHAGVTITGTVTDKASGWPIPNVLVELNTGETTHTNSKGQYSLENLEIVVFNISFSKTGYQTITKNQIYVEDSLVLNIQMAPPCTLNIITLELPEASVEIPYNSIIEVSCDAGPFQFELVYGNLPSGLFLDSNYGNIIGTPTSPGSFTFCIGVYDIWQHYAQREFYIVVTEDLNFKTDSVLESATKWQPYVYSIEAVNGTLPYDFEIISGAFPQGIFMSETGKIGNIIFNEDFNNSIKTYFESSGDLKINEQGQLQFENIYQGIKSFISFNCHTAESSSISFDYGLNLQQDDVLIFYIDNIEISRITDSSKNLFLLDGISDGLHTFSWYFEKNSPEGNYSSCWLDNIKIDSIVSIPINTGISQMRIKVTDAAGRSKSKDFSIEVMEPLKISNNYLKNGIVGSLYQEQLWAEGGKEPYEWEIYYGRPPAGISLDLQTGLLSGIPEENSFGTIVISVQDSQGRLAFFDAILTVVDKLAVISSQLPDGLLNEPYFEYIQTKGGLYPLNFSLSGMLPDGLSINRTTGAINGVPETNGIFNINVTVEDSNEPVKQTITQSISLKITSNLTILTSAILPRAQKDEEITPIIFKAAGGTNPYLWNLSKGLLPEGISLDSNKGIISGASKDKGDISFDMTVTDSSGKTAIKTFLWYISDSLSISTDALPDAICNMPYQYVIKGKGGYPPYSWRIKSGALLTGLLFNTSTATISGTPTISNEIRTFTVEISDSDIPSQIASSSFVMQVLPDQLYIVTSELPLARVNQFYSHILKASLGTPPYNWRIKSGFLPDGISLVDESSARISGKPEQQGDFYVEIEVQDSGTPYLKASKGLNLRVEGNIEIKNNLLKNACAGKFYTDRVIAQNGILPYNFNLIEGNLYQKLQLNQLTGEITGISELIPGKYTYFTIQVNDSGNPQSSAKQEFFIYGMQCDLIIDPKTFPQAVVMMAYELQLNGQGGFPPYRFYLDNGNLPQGLIINSDSGIVSGTPQQKGTYLFTIRMEDASSGLAQQSYKMNVIDCEACPLISGHVLDNNNQALKNANIVFIETSGYTSTFICNEDGYYENKVKTGWTGTVIPQSKGYEFEPDKHIYNQIMLDQNNQDFTANIIMYEISGIIKDSESGTGIENVTIRYGDGGAFAITDKNGYYKFLVPYSWNGTVMPEKNGYRFEPVSISYESLYNNFSDQNYIAVSTFKPDIDVSPLSIVFNLNNNKIIKKSNLSNIKQKNQKNQNTNNSGLVKNKSLMQKNINYSTGLIVPESVTSYWKTHSPDYSYRKRKNISSKLDWSKYDSPIRDQKSCGSCWAFAAVALLENLSIRSGIMNNIDLSEQVMVSCVYKDRSTGGCDGGWYWDVFNYTKKNGAIPESCFNYIARNGNCNNQCEKPDYKLKLTDFTPAHGLWEKEFSVDDLKGALQEGPLCVGFYVPDSFYRYNGGIYDYKQGNMEFGHAVLLVGYDDDNQCFKAKNSWGKGWGEDGYFRIAYNDTSDIKFGCYASLASGVFLDNQGKNITISNNGTGNLKINSLYLDKNWLGIEPLTISQILPGEKKIISVFIKNYSEIVSPEDKAVLKILSNDQKNPEIDVNISVINKPQLERPSLIVSPPFEPNVSIDNNIININVDQFSGKISLYVSNGGSAQMDWSVETLSSWISIDKGITGTNQGEIILRYLENNTKSMRTGAVNINADGADNSPAWIKIYQSYNNLYQTFNYDMNNNGYSDPFDIIICLQLLSDMNTDYDNNNHFKISLKDVVLLMKKICEIQKGD